MSILIKGMDMPTGCYTCPIIYSEDGVFDFECPFNSYLLWHDTEDVIRYRPDSCPLVEVPTPHGRLIDADYLKKDRINISGTDFVLLVDVDNAKTIIEAEVGKQ